MTSSAWTPGQIAAACNVPEPNVSDELVPVVPLDDMKDRRFSDVETTSERGGAVFGMPRNVALTDLDPVPPPTVPRAELQRVLDENNAVAIEDLRTRLQALVG